MSKTNNTSRNNDKKFTPDIGFWPAQSGNGFTSKVTEQMVEVLQSAKAGDRLYLEAVESENPKAPAFRVKLFSDDKTASI